MIKSFLGAIPCFILLLVLLSTLSNISIAQAEQNHGNEKYKTLATSSDQISVTLGLKTILATVANTDSTRVQGLLGWSKLAMIRECCLIS